MHGIVDIHGSHEKMDAGMPEIPVSCIFRFLAYAGGDIGRWIVVISSFRIYCLVRLSLTVCSIPRGPDFHTLQDMAEEVY